jgi:DNA repair protein RadC
MRTDPTTRHNDSPAHVDPFTSAGNSPPQPARRPRPRRATPAARYLAHLSYTIVREQAPTTREKLDTPEAAVRLARAVIPDDGREHFVVALLDSQNRLTYVHHVSTGSLSASIVHPREVLGPAIREGAAHLILAHNHPSGDPTPSREDIALTRQLAEGARLLGLKVHDHVVIGSGTTDHVSLATQGLL